MTLFHVVCRQCGCYLASYTDMKYSQDFTFHGPILNMFIIVSENKAE